MAKETTADITFSLRVPNELNEKLCVEAETKRRTRQSQILFMLEQYFENANGSKREKKK